MYGSNKYDKRDINLTSAFNVLGPLLKERMLTETLRYFLDSSESHGLCDKLLRALAKRSGLSLPKKMLIVVATSEWSTDAGREVDVVATVRASWDAAPLLVLGIEAKLSSKESASQISDYQLALAEAFPKIKKHLFFVTPSGYAPDTENKKRNSECPVTALCWADIAECLTADCSDSSVALEFADHLQELVRAKGEVKSQGSFFEKCVLVSANRAIRAHYRNPAMAGLKWAWVHGKDEFNFYHTTNELGDGFRLIWMLYSPAGPAAIGRQIDLLLMAYSNEGLGRKDVSRLAKLKKKLPPREGRRFQWGPWTFLWSFGCRTLVDMEKKDELALATMVARAYVTIQPVIDRAVAELWPTEELATK